MYGLAGYALWRQRSAHIRQETTMARLAKTVRADHRVEPTVVQILRWELARYAGLLGRCIRNFE